MCKNHIDAPGAGHIHHMRRGSRSLTFSTATRSRQRTTPFTLLLPYARYTTPASTPFIDSTTRETDHGPQGTTPPESWPFHHARDISLHTRDVSGISTGGISGASVGAMVVFALIFGLLYWKCPPKFR